MGKKKSGNPKKNKTHQTKNKSTENTTNVTPDDGWNFVTEAGPGCYIARRDDGNGNNNRAKKHSKSLESWLIEWEDLDPDEFQDGNDEEEIPDIAVDPEEQTLSVCNPENYAKVAYVTVYETTVVGAHGKQLLPGVTTDNQGVTQSCVTFIVLCPPRVFVHLCFLDILPDQDITELRIESDVSMDLCVNIGLGKGIAVYYVH
jgi:hypothetical protein